MLSHWTNAIASAKPKIALTASDDRVVRFVYVGEVRREKGIQELIHAFRRARDMLQSNHISITLDIFGPTKSDFHDTFYDLLNSSEHITYHGYVDHAVLIEQLGHFDALVLPTYFPSEGYPGVVLEAMSFGLPVIATRWRSIPEIVIHEENGLLCEPRDIDGLANCMIRIALGDQLRRHLGEKAREVARQFDVNVILPRLCALCGLKVRMPVQR
jgi:glycosyltransferase involved in cell wall biosynthesis